MTKRATSTASSSAGHTTKERWLFWACFVALVATAFGFVTRAFIVNEWGNDFGLSETQKGEILGVGLWPFAISIVLCSFVIDKFGYGRSMAFAFTCHVSSAIITIVAPFYFDPYWSLYIGTFIVALGNGSVEAVINPVVATMFPRQKTKWLNILHAGWPGGLVLGGLLTLSMNADGLVGQFFTETITWHWKVGLILIPTLIYGAMLISCRFPISERVMAGVSYKAMLQEVGIIGCLVTTSLIIWEVTRVCAEMQLFLHKWSDNALLALRIGITVLFTIPFAIYTKSLGRWLFSFLLLIMILLATTEVGTDAWIKELMGPEVNELWGLGLDGGWVLVYSATIMMVLRFCAGPICRVLSPLGMLAISCVLAAMGLAFLSKATGSFLLLAATIYGIGQTFFWPTTLGVVSERFPKGGALTLNMISAVGLLGVGVFGTPWLGSIQDERIKQGLQSTAPDLYAEVVGEPRKSVLGTYHPLNAGKVKSLDDSQQQLVSQAQLGAKKHALLSVAILPLIMFACYMILIVYFRAKGGYKPIELSQPPAME